MVIVSNCLLLYRILGHFGSFYIIVGVIWGPFTTFKGGGVTFGAASLLVGEGPILSHPFGARLGHLPTTYRKLLMKYCGSRRSVGNPVDFKGGGNFTQKGRVYFYTPLAHPISTILFATCSTCSLKLSCMYSGAMSSFFPICLKIL